MKAPVVCAECGVPRPFFGALAVDYDEAGRVVAVTPVCTFCKPVKDKP